MPVTKLKYLNDCYTREFEARVVKSSPEFVLLDQTFFYPEGGGQPCDTGFLEYDGKKVRVTSVQKKGEIPHYVSEPIPEGTIVKGVIDWPRRLKHMKMHISQHLISYVGIELWGLRTAGNQIGEESSRIDFEPVKFTPEMLKQLEDRSNEIIALNPKVKVYEVDRENITDLTDDRRSDLERLPASITRVRVIEIEGFDKCPCGGTHVESLGEVGNVKILSKKNKGKNRERITYELV